MTTIDRLKLTDWQIDALMASECEDWEASAYQPIMTGGK